MVSPHLYAVNGAPVNGTAVHGSTVPDPRPIDPRSTPTAPDPAPDGRDDRGDPQPLRRVRLTPASGVRLRPTYWLWDERIPQGALTIGPGREGIGKSLFCAWLAARVTHGELPGVHHGRPMGVVYAATEDSWERTLAGRLLAAGADMSRVYQVAVERLDRTVPLSLPRDCDSMAAELTEHDVALLILDPLISAVDTSINVNQEDLRGALEPLAKLADETGAAVFGLAHFNKATGTDVLSRITGSRAFAAVARSAVAFARDTSADDGSCVISQAKNNLGRLDLPSLRYTVDQLLNETPDSDDRDDRSEVDSWLTAYLAEQGGSATASDVFRQGQAAGGYSKDQLRRAKRRLGVTTAKTDMRGGWNWQLPPTPPEGGAEGSEGGGTP